MTGTASTSGQDQPLKVEREAARSQGPRWLYTGPRWLIDSARKKIPLLGLALAVRNRGWELGGIRLTPESMKRVTFGESDGETRSFGFAVRKGAPVARAAGAFAFEADVCEDRGLGGPGGVISPVPKIGMA